MTSIRVAMACDERYLPGAIATLAGVRLALGPDVPLEVDFLHDGLAEPLMKRVRRSLARLRGATTLRFHWIDSRFEGFPDFYFPSRMVYARLLLPELVDAEKILYVDSDLLVLKSPLPLFQNPPPRSGILAALETTRPRIADDPPASNSGLVVNAAAPYFNSGFLLLDLPKIRESGLFRQGAEILSRARESCKFWDQSALNYAANGRFDCLAQEWNTQTHRFRFDPVASIEALANRSINAHFVTKAKPWLAWSPFPAETLHRMLLDAVDPGWRRTGFQKRRQAVAWKYALAGPLAAFFTERARFKKNPASDLRTAVFWRQTVSDLKALRRRHADWSALREGWKHQIAEAMA
jgi:lipopolysaccharide biosynthesis glycosyltransferase